MIFFAPFLVEEQNDHKPLVSNNERLFVNESYFK